MSGKDRALTIVLSFLLGAAATLGFARLPRRRRRYDPDRLTSKFTRELSLSAAQQAQVRAVLGDTEKRLDALHEDARAKLSAIRADTRAGIRKILDPEQQKRFDEMAARWDARRKIRKEGK